MQRSIHVDCDPLTDLWIWRNRCFRVLPYESTACTIPYKKTLFMMIMSFLWKQYLQQMG